MFCVFKTIWCPIRFENAKVGANVQCTLRTSMLQGALCRAKAIIIYHGWRKENLPCGRSRSCTVELRRVAILKVQQGFRYRRQAWNVNQLDVAGRALAPPCPLWRQYINATWAKELVGNRMNSIDRQTTTNEFTHATILFTYFFLFLPGDRFVKMEPKLHQKMLCAGSAACIADIYTFPLDVHSDSCFTDNCSFLIMIIFSRLLRFACN